MRALPSPAIFTVDQALAAGWTQSALKHGVASGRLIRLRRGVYTTDREPGTTGHAVAGALAHRDAVVSHRSAALLHGLPLLGGEPAIPEVTVPPRHGTHLAGLSTHRARLRSRDVQTVRNIRVTTPARTVIDVARQHTVLGGVVTIDAAVARRMTTWEQIDDVLRFCWNWPRIARAQRAVRLADGIAESPLESVSRLVLRRSIPAPEPQRWIYNPNRRLIGRVDFYWDEFGVAGEADGRSKYDSRDVLNDEKQRQEKLEQLGLIVVRWGWTDAWNRPGGLATRLKSAFERGRLRDRSGFLRLWTQ